MFKVLIAVDGSESANRAIAAVGKMAQLSEGVEAVLLSVRSGAVLEPLFAVEYSESTIRKLDAEQEAQQSSVLANAAEYAKLNGLKVVSSLRACGVVANEIVRIAKEQKADQIAMGTHGRSAIGNLFLGSAAQRVLHQSDIPVLLVR